MNIEGHFYLTYLALVASGLTKADAEAVARSAQFVDENLTPGPGITVTQTYDVLDKNKNWEKVYKCLHFMPGDPEDQEPRRDRLRHDDVCTPSSENAMRVLDREKRSGNLFRFGMAVHMFCDTFTHQNFVGAWCDFNGLPGFRAALLPNIGHLDAKSKPDEPMGVWYDRRLKSAKVENQDRFLLAFDGLLDALFATDPQRKEFFKQVEGLFRRGSRRGQRLAAYKKAGCPEYTPFLPRSTEFRLFQSAAKGYFRDTSTMLKEQGRL